MKHYAHYGFTRVRRRARLQGRRDQATTSSNYDALNNDFTDRPRRSGEVDVHDGDQPSDWTRPPRRHRARRRMTGGRLKRLEPLLGDETFMLTYGDGVTDVDIRELLAFHERHGKLATVTAVRPPARFGGLDFDGDRVARVHREAADRRGLDQRRLLRARARRLRLPRRRRDASASASRSSGWPPTAS